MLLLRKGELPEQLVDLPVQGLPVVALAAQVRVQKQVLVYYAEAMQRRLGKEATDAPTAMILNSSIEH